MDKFWLVLLGGGLGSVSRFWLSGWVYERLGAAFPYGTLSVNLIGCFLIGLIAALSEQATFIPANVRLALVVGFLGGLTTFSTFAFESFKLMDDGLFVRALLNMLGSMALGLLAVWLGWRLALLGLGAFRPS